GHDAETVSRRIRVLTPGQRSVDNTVFATVAEATLAGHRLRITYHGRARDTAGERTVHPQRLVNYRNNWYLAADCEQAGDLRLFSLDRIRAATRAEGRARVMDDDRVERFVESSYGIFAGSASAWAVLQFSPNAARWAAEERWHPDQLGVWRGGAFELQVPYSDPTELVMEVLCYGPDVEVIRPPELRQRVADQLRRAVERY
ncbi:MAG: WYL domain-containing protein, partial [Spiribacter salinus]